jgi:hypothetical protein
VNFTVLGFAGDMPKKTRRGDVSRGRQDAAGRSARGCVGTANLRSRAVSETTAANTQEAAAVAAKEAAAAGASSYRARQPTFLTISTVSVAL